MSHQPDPAPTGPRSTGDTSVEDAPATDDQALARLAVSSADTLAAVIAAGMLDVVGQPAKLPELLFPDADPILVRAVWELALPTGYRAGQLSGRPRWAESELERARTALSDAGYTAMAAVVDRTAGTEHPADVPAGSVRGEHQ